MLVIPSLDLAARTLAKDGDPKVGDQVLVTGCGPIGAMTGMKAPASSDMPTARRPSSLNSRSDR